MAGSFGGSLDVGAGPMVAVATTDGFVARFDGAGSLKWAHQLGGDGSTSVAQPAITDDGLVVVHGHFTGTLAWGEQTFASAGAEDGFLAAWDTQGVLVAATEVSNAASLTASGVACGDQCIVFGSFTGDLDFGHGPLAAIDRDVFIAAWVP
jgi:hypothetical protein